MSPARRAARAGRNLLIALLVGAVLIVAIVAAYIVGRTSNAPEAASAGPSQTLGRPSQSSSATTDAAPTGCLGGQGRDSTMLLAAQAGAQHSTYGAVEVATAFYRWTYRFPAPSEANVRAVAPVFLPGQAAKAEASLIAGYRRNPNPSIGVVRNGTPFYVSTVGGKWIAQPGSSPGVQRVTVEAPYVIDGVLSPTKTATASFQMQWADGGWRVAGLSDGDPARVAAGGTTFTAGC